MILIQEHGVEKWSNITYLTPGGTQLINFEPGEVVKIKSVEFRIQTIQLEPPILLLVPLD